MKRGIDLIRALYPEPSEVKREMVLDALSDDPSLDLTFTLTAVPRFRADPSYWLWTFPQSGGTDFINFQSGPTQQCTLHQVLRHCNLSLPSGIWYPTPLPKHKPLTGPNEDLERIFDVAEAAAGIGLWGR